MKPEEIAALDQFASETNGPWAAIEAEVGHPIPSQGARLCKRIPDVGWVVVSMGHQRVMTEIARKANKAEQNVAQETVREIAAAEGYPKAIAGMAGVGTTEEGI